jgi:DNA polymerase (family X)
VACHRQRVEEQRAEIARLNAELAPFRILHGTELEIRADASLDYPDELLARFDVVIASIHTGRGQPGEQLTRRAIAAIEHPHVDVLAHPSGQIVNRRDPLPLDWPRCSRRPRGPEPRSRSTAARGSISTTRSPAPRGRPARG